MSEAHLVVGASGKWAEDYADWVVCACLNVRTARELAARAEAEIGAAVAADNAGEDWESITARLTVDKGADVCSSTHYAVKSVPLIAIAMEAAKPTRREAGSARKGDSAGLKGIAQSQGETP